MKYIFILHLLFVGSAISARAQQSGENEPFKVLPSGVRGQQVCVLGNVMKPTAITVKDTISLMQAIGEAGGPTPNTKHRVNIYRRMPDGYVGIIQVKDLQAVAKGQAVDVTLQPDDLVQVLSRNKRTRIPMQYSVPCDSSLMPLLPIVLRTMH